ncbi:Uncharacterized protein TCM_035690 [Theobroma cacao]|uniref:Zinc knuckle CX2CX4HX4C domain-containing protein n=1 Tax=Theobroma cacao TaxID=3641 RepID=A0A061FQK2_THECC|nr:Uncharacterized protein TCM_035690 [Theobroma cacao]
MSARRGVMIRILKLELGLVKAVQYLKMMAPTESPDVMDDIHSKWRNFRLSEEEEEEACPTQIKSDAGAQSTRHGKEFCLVGLVWESKAMKGDYDRVIKGKPWCFDRSLLVLKEFEEDLMDLEVIEFKKEEFWIQVTGIPLKLIAGETAKAIGNLVGQYVRVDACENNQLKWINIQYERLSRFCYRCGVLGHNEKDYRIPCFDEEGKDVSNQYGPFLIAPLQRKTQRVIITGVEHDVNSGCKEKSRADNVLPDQS